MAGEGYRLQTGVSSNYSWSSNEAPSKWLSEMRFKIQALVIAAVAAAMDPFWPY